MIGQRYALIGACFFLGAALFAAEPPVDSAKTTDADDSVDDLPLIEVSVADTPKALCVIVTGDGGWAALDKAVSAALASEGIATVGLNSLKYFWNERKPDEAAKALERIVRHYSRLWKTKDIILVGYSFGADVIPFMASRLPDDLKTNVKLVAMLGASPNATFAFHFADWLPGKTAKSPYPTKDEVAKLKGMKVLCLYGENDDDCVCEQLTPEEAHVVKLPGAHHFDGDYDKLAALILAEKAP